MEYANFAVLIDEIKGFTEQIVMNFAGEPLLNKHLGRMAAYAESNGIRTIIGTNGTLDQSEALVACGVSEILFSLDGATEESYRQYRTYKDGTCHDDVLANLRKLVAKKRELHSAKPMIILQFVVFKHNEHEIGQIIELARAIGADGIDFKPACINDFFVSPLSDLIEKFAPHKNGVSDMPKIDGVFSKPPWCSFSFHQTQILWNGDVTTCCYDFDGAHVVGNAFTDGGFKKVWKGKQYREKRRQNCHAGNRHLQEMQRDARETSQNDLQPRRGGNTISLTPDQSRDRMCCARTCLQARCGVGSWLR
jgi:hypothetical protein